MPTLDGELYNSTAYIKSAFSGSGCVDRLGKYVDSTFWENASPFPRVLAVLAV